MGSSLFSVVILYTTEAYRSHSERKMSVLNEFSVLSVTYCFLCFDVLDVEANFWVGYVAIGAVGLYILVCLVIIIVLAFKAIRRKLQTYCAKRYFKKQRKALQDTLKETHRTRHLLRLQ